MPSSTAWVKPADANILGDRPGSASRFAILLLGDAKPAEPFAFVRIGPQGGVARPQALHLIAGLPILERGLHGLREISRQADT